MRQEGLGRPPVRGVRAPSAVQALSSLAFALSILSLAGIPACSGSSPSGDDRERPFAAAPTEGTIVLYEPNPKGTGRKTGQVNRGFQPTTVRITTQEEKRVKEDDPIRIEGGEIEDDTGTRRPTRQDSIAEIIRRTKPSAFVVSPRRFAALWAELDAAGMFLLPRFRGGIPPQDKPSISVTASGKTWIFLRPTEAPARDLPKEPEKLQKVAEAWGKVKKTIIACTLGY